MGAAAESLKRFLSGLLRIQPGEGRKTALMFGILMCVVGFFITGRVVRDSLFLSRYPVDYLPYLYIWVALGVSLQSYLYSRVADRFRRDQTLTFSLLCVAGLALFARVALYWVGDWFYPVLYVLIELAGTLLVIQVWTLANDVFTTREAKRLFGLVGAGGVVSAVVVGFSVRGLVKVIGTENLLYLCSLALVLGLLLAVRLVRVCRDEILSSLTEGRRPGRARIAFVSDWNRFFKSRHLVFVAGLIVLLGFVITFVDYQFKVTARNAYLGQEAQLAGFFGLFWAITGAVNCFIQFFVTGRLLERLGILVALLILPVSLLLGTGAVLIAPALWSATLLKGGETVFRYTVNDATVQLLYLPVPAQFRGRAKAFIDGILRPLAIGTAGVVLAWVIPNLAPGALGWALVVLLFGWILFAVGVRRQYFQSLLNTLRRRRLHFGEIDTVIPDQAAAKVLRKALADPHDQNVLHALEMLRFSPGVDWSEDLARLVRHPMPAIRARVLHLLGEIGQLKDGPTVFGCLADKDPEVRAAAVEAYCAIGKARAIRSTTRFLEDRDVRVRSAAVVGLMRYGGLDGILSSAEQLKGLFESDRPEERAAGAGILGDIGVKNFYHPLLALLVDPDDLVRNAAIRSAGKMGSHELLPALVYRIEDPATRGAATEALAVYGASAIKLLKRVLSNRDESPATRLAIPAILARIGTQEAMELLMDHLEDPDESLRTQVLEAVHRLRIRKPHLHPPGERARHAVLMEVRDLYAQWFVTWDLRLGPENHLLEEALEARRAAALKRTFRLLGCLYPVRSVDAVFNNLSAPTRRIRANAIEVLDNMLDKEIKRLLLPLIDDALEEHRRDIGQEVFGIETRGQDEQLTRLMGNQLGWLCSCALFVTGQLRKRDLASEVLACTVSDSPLVRETALMTLQRLVPAEEMQRTADRHLRDPSANVRKYANWILQGSSTA